MKRVMTKLLLATLLLAALAGCSLQRPVARHAVDYNRAVEKAHNQTVLLNVVRSMKRLPQHYTAISEVRGTATSSLSPALSLTLEKGTFTPWDPSARYTGTGQSLVTVSVLDDKEFVQGLLSPISLDQLDFFLTQGWPERLVGMLFVRRIDIRNDDFSDPAYLRYCGEGARKETGSIVTYENAPDESDDAGDPFRKVRCFAARLAHLRDKENLGIEDKVTKSVDFELQTTDQDELAELILKAVEAGVSIKKGRRGESGESVTYSLSKSVRSKVLKWGEGGDRKEVYLDDPTQTAGARRAKPGEKTVRVYFRSAQNVVYYLGEIMRAQAIKGWSSATPFEEMEPKVVFAENEEALLFAAWRKGRGEKNPLVSVEHGGETYVIPGFQGCEIGRVDHCHRSTQVLAIVKQLIGLNKKRESLSTTGVVTAIGG